VSDTTVKPAPDNGAVLRGQLLQRGDLRTSPTGIPVLECIVWHESHQQEASASRRLSFACPAKALGEVAARLSRESPSQWLLLSGFLAPRRGACAERPLALERYAPGLIFHITDYELEKNHGL